LSQIALWTKNLSEQDMRQHWLMKLDQITLEQHLRSDAQLAVYLGISRQALSKIRNGASRLPSLATQMQIVDALKGVRLTNQIWNLLPKKQADAMKLKSVVGSALRRNRWSPDVNSAVSNRLRR
jgi:transcriptional regulator with XRE-family HTH domain